MPPCAADRFDEMLVRLFTVCDKRFDTAPNFERWVFTVLMAVSMAVMAAIALEGLSRVGLWVWLVDEPEPLLDEAVENMAACTSEEVSVPEDDSHAARTWPVDETDKSISEAL